MRSPSVNFPRCPGRFRRVAASQGLGSRLARRLPGWLGETWWGGLPGCEMNCGWASEILHQLKTVVNIPLFIDLLGNFHYKIWGDTYPIRAFFNTHFVLLGLGCSPPFYTVFFGVRAAFFSEVHLLGDSYVQCHRFPFFRDHMITLENRNFPTSWVRIV